MKNRQIEVAPTDPQEIADMQNHNAYLGHPILMDWERLKLCLWPAPDGRYRVYMEKIDE